MIVNSRNSNINQEYKALEIWLGKKNPSISDSDPDGSFAASGLG